MGVFGSRRASSGWPQKLPALLLVGCVAGLVLLTDTLYESHRASATPSFRTQSNRQFAARESYAEALTRFRNRWPPAYPSALYLARRSDLPADDVRLARGVAWLKANQRASGRWFTRSLKKDSHHFLTHAGTNLALMGLAACGALD